MVLCYCCNRQINGAWIVAPKGYICQTLCWNCTDKLMEQADCHRLFGEFISAMRREIPAAEWLPRRFAGVSFTHAELSLAMSRCWMPWSMARLFAGLLLWHAASGKPNEDVCKDALEDLRRCDFGRFARLRWWLFFGSRMRGVANGIAAYSRDGN